MVDQTAELKKPSTLAVLGIILAVIGLAISFYSLQHHIELKTAGQTDAFCNINQTFSCDDVANSSFSEDPWGNPLGLYGIGYFLGLMLLLIASFVKEEYKKDTMPTYALMTGLGVVTSIALFLISYFQVGSLCLSCMGVYSVTLIQVLVTFFLREEIPPTWSLKGLYNGAFYMLIALLGSVTVFQVMEPMPNRSNFTPDLPQSSEEIKKLLETVQGYKIEINRSPYSGLGEDYRKGGDSAKVVIVKFADFQCPACRDAAQTLKALEQEFGDRILVVYKNFPLDKGCNKSSGDLHQYACEAAKVARCAGQYGNFWAMHDKIYANQDKLDSNRLKLWALESGISEAQYKECMQSQDILNKIKADVDQGLELNIRGTPAIYINGVPAQERSYPALKQRVSMMLGM